MAVRLARRSRSGDERADVVEVAAVEVERAAERDELEGVVALVRLAAGALARRRAEAREAHERYHALKLVTLRRPLDFDGRDFHDVCPLVAAA